LKIGQQNYLFEQKIIQGLELKTVAAQNYEISCTKFSSRSIGLILATVMRKGNLNRPQR
jgi:hypothetical protein